MSSIVDYIDCFSINKGDRIWLSSELLKIALAFKKNGIDFDGGKLIDVVQEKIGEEGSLLIPTFSFEFSNNKYYDYNKTRGASGALGNIALSRPDFVRTSHPMHSFAVWGADKKLLAEMKNKNSFGVDSPFGYCIGNSVRQIILGTDYVHAMTLVHYAEYVCNVPYRFSKSFTGVYVNKDGIKEERTYDYAARKLEISPEERFNRLGSLLEEHDVSRKIEIEGIECYDIDLAASFPIICEDIIMNQCRNLYDFNVPRECVFK